MIGQTPKALIGTLAGLMLLSGTTAAWGQRQESPEAMHQRASAMGDANRDEARKLWDAACTKGYVPSCMALGASYNVGSFFGSIDGALKSRAAYSRACDLGHGEGCLKLGDAQTPIGLFSAPKGAQDWAGATAAYRKACDTHRIANACLKAGEILGKEANPKADVQLANTYRKRACDLGVEKACTDLAVANVRARTATATEAHTSKYGKVDGIAPASPELLKLLLERRAANGGSSVLKEADIVAIRDHLLADGRIDDQERDLLVELTWPNIRAVRIYRAGDADPWNGEGTTFSSVSTTRRDPLIALLDNPPAALTWDDADRKGTLMRLARASRTPGMEAPVKAVIAGKVAQLAAAMTKDSKYQPLGGMILELSSTAKALEEECKLPRLETDAIRQMFFDATESGVAQSGADLPRFYSFLKPNPSIRPIGPADLPTVCTEKPKPAGQ